MSPFIIPKLKQNEPVEVAMGGYMVTTYTLIDSTTGRSLSPHIFYKDFLMLSPENDFGFAIQWNSLRDEGDFSFVAIDTKSGNIESLFPLHSIPTDFHWVDKKTASFKARVRPSVSGLKTHSEFDLAKSTEVVVKKEISGYDVRFIRFVDS